MIWLMPVMIVALAVLGPLFGADTRDGLTSTPNNFWLPRRRTRQNPR